VGDKVDFKCNSVIGVFRSPNGRDVLNHSGPVGIGTHHAYRRFVTTLGRNVIGDEGTEARSPNQDALVSQLAERLTDRRATDGVYLAELALGGDSVPWTPQPTRDLLLNKGLELVIDRKRRRTIDRCHWNGISNRL
jgi:hypothetical protein